MNTSTRKAAKTVGLIAGTSAALAAISAGGYALYRKFLDGTPEMAGSIGERISRALRAPRGASADDIRRYADSPREWTRIPPSGVPQGARKVPIKGHRWTALAPSRANNWPTYANGKKKKFWEDRALFLAVVNDMRAALRACGRGDEDVRCVLWLHALETGFGQSAWDYNFGNRKTAPYASRELILNERSVYTMNPHADGVFLLVDRVNSFDSYPTFATLADGLAAEKLFFETSRGNGRGYAGVLPGYRQGGLDGLKSARTAQHNGGYSPGDLGAKLRACEFWWNDLGARILGAEWVR